MYLYSAREDVGSLRFTVDSHLEFPVLEVYLGERLLDSFVVDGRTTYATSPFTLAQGMNVFRFRAPGGCHQVVDDPRCWSDALLTPPTAADSIPCEPGSMRTACRTFVFDDVSFVPERELLPGTGTKVDFGDALYLRGWELDGATLRPGTKLTVTLAWEPTRELNDRYVVFIHLVSFDGTLLAQHDAPPVGQAIPLSAWPPGTTFGYPVVVDIPADLPPGGYRLLVGVYLWPDLERLPVLADVPGAEENVVEIARW